MSKNLYQKINAVMGEVETVYKDSKVTVNKKGDGYRAVSHDNVTKLLHGPIAKAGLVAIPNMDKCETSMFQQETQYGKKTAFRVDVQASVTFVNIDSPEEKVTTTCHAYSFDSGDKATGKAYSMALKYCYLKTFMLESSDEEESRDQEDHVKGMTMEKPENFLVQFGQWEGKRLSQIPLKELQEYVEYIESDAKAQNKKIQNPAVIDFISAVEKLSMV